jgi:hypothetical protein
LPEGARGARDTPYDEKNDAPQKFALRVESFSRIKKLAAKRPPTSGGQHLRRSEIVMPLLLTRNSRRPFA